MQPEFNASWRRQALQGDGTSVARLAAAALEPLYRFCFYRVGRNRHLCEEVVQETLVRAIRDLANYDPSRSGDDIFPWLAGLARNEIHRVLAREKSPQSLEKMWARMDEELRRLYASLESQPLDEDVLLREETCEMVNATMSQLPSHYRETLEAKYVTGHSVRQIAEQRSLTEKAVESQLSRARRAFRETFQALARNLSFEST